MISSGINLLSARLHHNTAHSHPAESSIRLPGALFAAKHPHIANDADWFGTMNQSQCHPSSGPNTTQDQGPGTAHSKVKRVRAFLYLLGSN